jgi:hypothetical protein
MVVRTVASLRSDESFEFFWLKVLKNVESFDLHPKLPRQRKRPSRYERGEADSEFHDNPKAYFRQHYYEAIDLIVNCIQDRFHQPGYKVYSNLEQLLLKASEGKDNAVELDFVCGFYKDDLQKRNSEGSTAYLSDRFSTPPW